MQSKLKIFFINICGWSALLGYEIWVISKMKQRFPWYQFLFYYLLNVPFFYSILFSLFKLSKKNTAWIGILLIPIILVGYKFLSLKIFYLVTYLRFGKVMDATDEELASIVYRKVTFITYSLICFSAVLIMRINRKADIAEILRLKEVQEKKQIESDLILSQNAFLQAQINRHLLFNTLNYIYNEADKYSEKAGKAVGLLGDILHFGLKKPELGGTVMITDEIEQADKLIELQQLKFNNALNINFIKDIDVRCGEMRIIPLVILTFIENIFEHGDLLSPDFPVLIQIVCRNSQLHFITQNRKRSSRLQTGHGIGTENIKTRLKYRYPANSYQLVISNDEQLYTVNFKLNL